MKLTAEQRQEVIASLKKRYAESKAWLMQEETIKHYETMPERFKELSANIESIRETFEHLENGEDIDFSNGFNSGSFLPLFALATLFSGGNAKDGE